ncbi:hypothetical protein ACH5DS_002003, partial [Campylobacter coli]
MEFHFTIINIGAVTGISSFLILLLKYILERYSFIKYIKYKPNLQLLSALYKAEIEGYKFIKTGKDMALIGHTQDKWIKPYRCIISIFSKSQFLDESTNEIYIYKIDLFLLLMIKLLR